MRAPALVFVALASAFAGSSARADVLVLQDGERIEGLVRILDDEVIVELDIGHVSFAKTEIQRIERGTTAVETFEEKYRATARDSVPALLALARWAEQHHLAAKSRAIYRQVLSLAPQQADAHRALGHRKVGNAWVEPPPPERHDSGLSMDEVHERAKKREKRHREIEASRRRQLSHGEPERTSAGDSTSVMETGECADRCVWSSVSQVPTVLGVGPGGLPIYGATAVGGFGSPQYQACVSRCQHPRQRPNR